MKILVVRLSSIGDIVLASPIVRCLRQQLGADIHFLTKEHYFALVEASPYIEKVHAYVDDDALLLRLKQEQFDHVVDLHKNIRSLRLISKLGVPKTSFGKANIQKWMMVNFKFDLLPRNHIVDRYFEAVAPLGVYNDDEGLDFFFAPTRQPDGMPQANRLAFAIGAAHATKRLLDEQIIEICSMMRHPIAILGGQDEARLGKHLAEHYPHVTNFAGQADLQQSAAIIDKAGLVLTHDTGMMHIGAALKKPIISIWGNTIPRLGMYPYYPSSSEVFTRRFEVDRLSCRPCSKIGYAKCPRSHFRCMKDQDIHAIVNCCNEFLSDGTAS
ncbi:MAG: glycosyltransferase family 9 protein [Saprospiraceae bacterium]|nr:glycosyltransferase family 9 protein [Saprospiraceae bacterium]